MNARKTFGLVLMFAAGCQNNAILELELTLPPACSDATCAMDSDCPLGVACTPDGLCGACTGDDVYAFVQMRTNTDFDRRWSGADPLDGFLLNADGSRIETISTVAQPAEYERDLLVRVTFCSDARCAGFGDDRAPERRLEIEHPFYELKRTRTSWEIEAAPSGTVEEAEIIDRCAVRGCRMGTTTDFCRLSDGSHFCQ